MVDKASALLATIQGKIIINTIIKFHMAREGEATLRPNTVLSQENVYFMTSRRICI